jgi:predicted nucleic acid-binding protein
MAPTVYIETSIVSYLTARPSRDLVRAAHQQATHDWWENQRPHFDLLISQLVLQEASRGDPDAAKRRLDALQEIKLLPIPLEAADLAQQVTRARILTPDDFEDALHISIATVYGIDCLLTWNFKHMANVAIQRRIAALTRSLGFEMPAICTPLELIGE